MFRKFLALTMFATMALGTVANAQEVIGEGIGAVPVEYQSKSTFTVVLPDSISLDSTKTQEFEIYLKDYELNDGDKVKVKPVNDKFTMEAPPNRISYYVGEDANSYFGFPVFPTNYSGSTSQGYFYYIFKDYILTKQGDTYFLYGIPKGELNNTRLYCTTSNLFGNITYKIAYDGNCTRYKNEYGGSIDKDENISYGGNYNMCQYMYNEAQNTWVSKGYVHPTSNDVIIQSTLPIYEEDTDEPFIQYSKEVKAPVDVLVNMSGNYLIDDAPITCTIDGSALSSGNWNGELMFEISLVQ